MKNKRNFFKRISWLWVTICLLLAIAILFVVRNINRNHNDVDYQPRICGGTACFMVELARTEAQQELGLMNITSMPEKNGMLFIFPKPDLYNFRMKNTLIPLDMLRMDDQMKVVHIANAVPCTADPCEIYRSDASAKYVLEINAGMAKKSGIQEWTQMKSVNIY